MAKVYWLKGLPASGKSTVSQQLLLDDPDAIRVNKDSIRAILKSLDIQKGKQVATDLFYDMVFLGLRKNRRRDDFVRDLTNHMFSHFSKGNVSSRIDKAKKAKSFGPLEKVTIATQTVILHYFVGKHKNIIVDDTNYNPTHRTRIGQICPKHSFQVVDMHADPYKVTLAQCISRNEKRDAKVPKVAIYGMAKKYEVFETGPKQEPYVTDKRIVICDIDGTLADINHRLHFLNKDSGEKADWPGFFNAMESDTLRKEVKSILVDSYPDHDIVIFTGRPNDYREVTEEWLKKHKVPYEVLFMRKSGDHRPDNIVKQEMLDSFVDRTRIDMVIDDRKQVILMWQQNGLKVTDVSIGDNDF